MSWEARIRTAALTRNTLAYPTRLRNPLNVAPVAKYTIVASTITTKRIQIGKGRFRGIGKGPDVLAADELVGGHKFADIDGFKKLVLEDPDQFARSLTEKLLIYGTGHGLEFSDRATVRKVVAEIRPKNYGFRALIHTIVQSDTFRSK